MTDAEIVASTLAVVGLSEFAIGVMSAIVVGTWFPPLSKGWKFIPGTALVFGLLVLLSAGAVAIGGLL